MRNGRTRRKHTFRDGIEGVVCPRCNTWKPLAEFHPSKQKWDGISSYCKVCRNKDTNSRKKAWREKKPTKFVVVSDPLPYFDGGFRPGAEFPRRDVEEMLRLATITPGAILRANSRKMRVVEPEGKSVKLRLVPVRV